MSKTTTTTSKSAKAKVLSYLRKTEGQNTLTAAQMTARFGVANPSATINELRNEGYAIYLNKRTTKSGDVTASYRLGTPSKAVVAAGIRAMRDAGQRAF